MMMTAAIKQANKNAKAVQITMTHYDEYRVNFIAGRENTAYYTNNEDDAIETAKIMDREVSR